MKKVRTLSMIIDMFKMLAENEYSLAWELIEDFVYNGHLISVKRSTQFKHVIIDNAYYAIGGSMVVVSEGVEYEPLQFVEHILSKEA